MDDADKFRSELEKIGPDEVDANLIRAIYNPEKTKEAQVWLRQKEKSLAKEKIRNKEFIDRYTLVAAAIAATATIFIALHEVFGFSLSLF